MLASLALASACMAAQAQECIVRDAQVTNSWTTDNGREQFANVHIQLAPSANTRGTVSVRAKLKIRYQRSDGWESYETTSARKQINCLAT